MIQANAALDRLSDAIRHWPAPELVTRTLARREAVQSSQIEGTQTDLDQLLVYEATLGMDGLPVDVLVTERYVQALQYGLDAVRKRGRSALSLALVNQLHAMLMQDAPDDFPKGAYRNEQAIIGALGSRPEDARFIPSPPDRIGAAMQELERSMLQYRAGEEEQSELIVVAQLAIAHAQFETIHPYKDGNGRTGRLLMPLILAAEGYPPLYLSGALLRSRNAYYDALNQVQIKGNWTPWMDMLCKAIVESAHDAMSIADDMTALVQMWSEKLKSYRRDSVAQRLPNLLIGHPVVTAAQVAALLDVSERSALTGIYALQKEGVLVQGDERKWGRTYYAQAVLDRLNQLPVPPKIRAW
ncbi:Fic family protein [Stenotrophomonas sp. ISL-67]|uniref:Fic family protein n=1 Tax=Stenotrophomonas sp. ISL-67 TaxID=2819171 RepID=UPI001BEBCC5F|nr:Fic/DOC family N-terminal domain-containing protein [Stenotrophomonas sp. ISL-67]MBT2767259.1 Fic family protein [Stenotrophomonas sp. ISL-67]